MIYNKIERALAKTKRLSNYYNNNSSLEMTLKTLVKSVHLNRNWPTFRRHHYFLGNRCTGLWDIKLLDVFHRGMSPLIKGVLVKVVEMMFIKAMDYFTQKWRELLQYIIILVALVSIIILLLKYNEETGESNRDLKEEPKQHNIS